jgi:hypothetical protein
MRYAAPGTLFALPGGLIDAAIAFANLSLERQSYRAKVRDLFASPWELDKVPTLQACEEIQQELRQWLAADVRGGDRHRPAWAVMGKRRITFSEIGPNRTRGPEMSAALPWADPGDPTFRNIRPLEEFRLSDERVSRVFDPGIEFAGKLLCVTGANGPELAWSYEIQRASLRATLGVAVVSLCQAGLAVRLGLCSRPGCGTYYIDRKSRGVRRKYCKTAQCNKWLSRAGVAKFRSNAVARKKRSKK